IRSKISDTPRMLTGLYRMAEAPAPAGPTEVKWGTATDGSKSGACLAPPKLWPADGLGCRETLERLGTALSNLAAFGPLDRGAQAEVNSARRTDTPTQRC